jgi:hypothetical protein
VTAARAVKPKPLAGRSKPRIAPPLPARSLLADFRSCASDLDLELMPWQEIAARYMTATNAKGDWLFPEVALLVARQNGKSTLLLPRILLELRAGRRVLHTAQNREIPRETFELLAGLLDGSPEVAPRGIRWANGQETIKFANGARYILVAPRHGVRGHRADLVIQDEVREQHDESLRAAMLPTLTASRNPQTIYLSNAGDEESVVLNGLRRRKDEGGTLAYLEWSASPERSLDDEAGWAEANPALGHTITLDRLRESRQTLTNATFETEHLCRWVVSTRERLVDEYAWNVCEGPVTEPRRPFMGICMDPSGTRASAAIAWQMDGGDIALRLLLDGTGSPIDTSKLGRELREKALRLGVANVGFDPLTDAELAKFFRKSEPISGGKFANASARFVTAVAGRRVRWDDARQVTDDLTWTARKPHDESGSYQAVRAKDDRPITAALAAIRAVWLASGPKPVAPKVM